jgi:beta-lactamase class C
MKQGKRKKKYYRLAGTLSIIFICAILVFPFFRHAEIKSTPQHREAVISSPPNPYVTQLISDYEKEIYRLLERSSTPGAAITIVRDSSIVYMRGFGVKASNTKDSVDVHTVFRLASVSKCFASFLTGILVEENVLDWHDRVLKHVPGFELKSADQTDRLTISHVLSHTTGLPYHTYTNLVEEGLDLNTLLAKLKEVDLSSDVGKEYSYQNVAYSIIGEVIGRATASSYEAQMREKVFVPLQMNNSSIDYESLMANPNIAKPHRMAKRKWVPTKINDTYYNVSPAGGVNASIADMANWMVALLGNREDVITNETLQHLYAPAILARSKNRNYRKLQRFNKSYYGLGWRILHYPSDTLVYHGGYVTGYRSEVAVDPKDDIAICILANAPGELADNGIPVFFHLFNKYRAKIIAWERKEQLVQK